MDIIVNPEKNSWTALQSRSSSDDETIKERVSQIVADVTKNGDSAIRKLSQEIDGVDIKQLQVSNEEIDSAAVMISSDLKDALGVAADNIRKFHTAQINKCVDIETTPGVRCIQKSVAIESVGLYIPGGSAPLFSTVLMLAIPAKTVGCKKIILCTPPAKNGSIAPEILYTAQLCGVDTIYKVGGAQAIAAMAHGTETISRVDKIFGPGNRYVTNAKQIVSQSQVAIDIPAGPSEVMVLADETAKAEFIAADLLSQAEHGADSQSILVTNTVALAERVLECVEDQLKILSRADIARKALNNSRIIVLSSQDEMIEFANSYAAEHLIISMDKAFEIADKITAAGSIFLGNYTPESAGDYASGTNHTLPTFGWAKSYSGVNSDSFVRKITIQEITKQGLSNIGKTITTMAYAEGLEAHAQAVNIRLK